MAKKYRARLYHNKTKFFISRKMKVTFEAGNASLCISVTLKCLWHKNWKRTWKNINFFCEFWRKNFWHRMINFKVMTNRSCKLGVHDRALMTSRKVSNYRTLYTLWLEIAISLLVLVSRLQFSSSGISLQFSIASVNSASV